MDRGRRDELRVEVGVKESYEMKNWQLEHMPRKWREGGGEEDRECDGRTAVREIWEEWEENGGQQQKIEGTRDW